ncbi:MULTISPECIES: hypothetical protein [Delftia]|uniref:hypothetical protein n=1 Tax=Delftia TaxID=80865 RepID=UPI000F841FE9|nr:MULTISPECIES: hypothetical protein [Delftia]MCO5340271.1 hypothetical protein [Delftia tsuruhatensis]MCR4547718.1 hypothetical protein [Delftia tsuruhatensis]MDH0777571.1 hypothetical protein [Delftia tsuruhatensis]MDH1461912.1 hypothetical protein [Delftia tsuruhatensis]MDH1827050.1 hypothetical protein [Delftia tsuruhatensis]
MTTLENPGIFSRAFVIFPIRKTEPHQRIKSMEPEKVSQKDKRLRNLTRESFSKCKQLFIQPVRFLQSISVSHGTGLRHPTDAFIMKMHQSSRIIDFFMQEFLLNPSFDAQHPRPPR